MRPEIPPSPDIPTATPKPPGNRIETKSRDIANIPTYAVDDLALLEENRRTILADRERHVKIPSASNSQPTSPLSHPEGSRRRLSDVKTLDSTNTASPTAIPFRWREPPPSPGSSRPSPSTPLSSLGQYPDIAPTRSKIRPRSTEFKASTEFRPLWLVERHASRQEPAAEEVYPSLPSSHTTSRASSVHDPEDTNIDHDREYDLVQSYFEPVGGKRRLVIDTEKAAVQSDLLDSQEPTPTASSFHAAERGEKSLDIVQDQPSKSIGETIPTPSTEDFREASDVLERELQQASPSRLSHEPSSESSSASAERGTSKVLADDLNRRENSSLQKATEVAAIIGGSATVAIAVTSHHDQPPERISPEAQVDQSHEDEKALVSEVDRNATDDDYFQEADFSIKGPKKGKKKDKKRTEASSIQETELPTSTPESVPISSRMEPSLFSVKEQMALQEKDARDAVDSWFAPVTPMKTKKDKNGKKKGQKVNIVEEPPTAVSTTVSPIEVSTAAALGTADMESAEEPALGFEDEKEAKLEAPTFATKSISDDQSNSAKPSESDHLTREMPASEVVNVMTAAAQGTNIPKDDLLKSDPNGDQPHVEDEWQAFGGKSKKKGRENKKASFEPWEVDAIESSQPDVVKPYDIDTSFTKTKYQDEAMSFSDKPAVEASQERMQELEVMDKQSDLGAPKESYEFPLLSKKKGKKGRKKAESMSQPDTPSEILLESPQQASRSLDREQNPSETSLLTQETIADSAPNTSEPVSTPTEELDSASAPVKKTKKSKKGRKTLRAVEDEDPVVPVVEEAGALRTKTADPFVRAEDQRQGQHDPKPFSVGKEVEREDQESTNRSVELQTNPWVSPEATPLPVDDDLDLLDALPESPLIIAADLGTNDLDIEDHRIGESAHDASSKLVESGHLSIDEIARDESLNYANTVERDLVSPEATPLPVDTDLDLLDALPLSPIVKPIEANGESTGPSDIKHRDFPSTIGTSQDSEPTEQAPMEVPVQEEADDATDGYFSFTTEKKGKKTKKTKQELPSESTFGLASEEGSRNLPFETVQTPEKDLQRQDQASKVMVQTPKEQLPVDGWATSGKKKGKKGKTQSLLVETSQASQSQEKDIAVLPMSSQPLEEDLQVWGFTDKQDVETPQEPPTEVRWASFSKKEVKRGKKQKSVVQEPTQTLLEPDKPEPTYLELKQSESKVAEPRQFQAELASDASFVDLPQYFRISQDNVQADAGTELVTTSDKPLLIRQTDAQHLSESTAEQSIDDDEWAMLTKKKKAKKGRESDFQDFDTSPGVPEVKNEKSINDTSMATTDTAREVQDMLAEANKASASSDQLGESVEDDKALTRHPLDKPAEKDDADDFSWGVSSKKKGKKGKKGNKAKLLLSDDPNTESIAPMVLEAQPEPLPLTEEPLVGVYGEISLEKPESEENRPFNLARTHSEPIISPDRGSSYIGLDSSVLPSAMTSLPEAEEIEQSRAVSPETAALLSRDDEKPPNALKAADIVPEPEFDPEFSSDSRPPFEREADTHGTPLAPIAEDQVPGIEDQSIATHPELCISEIVDKDIAISEATQVIPESTINARGTSEDLPPLSRRDQKRGKKGRKVAWDHDFDSQTPESETSLEAGNVQKDLASEAPEGSTDVQRDVAADDFEGFPKSAKGKKKSKKAKSAAADEEKPTHTPGKGNVPILSGSREVSIDDALNLGEAALDNPVVDESEGLGKCSRDKIKDKGRSSAREDDIAPPIPEAEPVQDIIENQKASIDDSRGFSTNRHAERMTDDFIDVPKSKKDKKKAKKSKASSWEDDGTTSTPEQMDAQEPAIAEEDPLLGQTVFEEPSVQKESVLTGDESTAVPKSKKDKKRAQKSKTLSWVDQGTTNTPEQLEEHELAVAGVDPPPAQFILNEPKESSLQEQPESVNNEFAAAPKSKKDKKKAKKSKLFSWEDEGTSTLEQSEPQELVATREDLPVARTIVSELEEPSSLKKSEPVTDDFDEFSKNKKNKRSKRSKKSWEEDTPSATPEVLEAPELLSSVHEISTEPVLEKELMESFQPEVTTTADPAIDTSENFPMSKNDKKKAMKSKEISWEDESGTATLERSDALKSFVAAENSSQELASAAGEVRDIQASPDQVAAEKAVREAIASTALLPHDALGSIIDSREEQKAEPEPGIDTTFSLKRSKKDKKAKKGQALNWDEEFTQAENSQPTQGSFINTSLPAPVSIPYADESSTRSPHQEVEPESGYMDFVQPFEKSLKALHLEERDPENRRTEFEALARGQSMTKHDASSINVVDKMGKPTEKDHLPDLQPVENLPGAFAKDTLPTTPAYNFEKYQDYQLPVEPAFDASEGDLANRDVTPERQLEIVEPAVLPTLDSQQTNEDNEDDDQWGMPVKKGKKGKKQRKDKSAASEVPRVPKDSYTPVPEDSTKALGPTTGSEQTANFKGQTIPPAIGETLELATIRDYEESTIDKDVEIPTFKASQPLEEKHEPVITSSDVKDFEDRGLGSSIAEATFTTIKKGKKGKKGKKQQAPIIWEDETATGPAVDEADAILDETTDPPTDSAPMPASFPAENFAQESLVREAEKQQHMQDDQTHEQYNDIPAVDESRGTVEESAQYRDTSNDYLGLSRVGGAGLIGEKDGVQLSETRQELSEQDAHTEPQESKGSIKALEVTNTAPKIIGHERATGEMPAYNDQAEPDRASASTQKSKKVKRSPRRDLDFETDTPPSFEQDLSTEPHEAQRSLYAGEGTDQALEIAGQEKVGEQHSEADWGYAPAKKGKKGKKTKTKDDVMDADTPKSGSRPIHDQSEGQSTPSESRVEGVATAAAAVLGLGIVAGEGLQRKDSKEGKKSKKNKKASKWTEFEDEEAPKPTEEEDEFGQAHVPIWTPEQQRPTIPPQRFQDTPPLSPPEIPHHTGIAGVNFKAPPTQSDYATNRDSAIQMSDSPIVSGRLPDHRVIRDSGFQDMEASPVVVSDPEHNFKTRERETGDAEFGMEHYERSLQSHQNGSVLADNPIDISIEVSPEYAVSVSKPRPDGDYHNLHNNKDRHTSDRRSRDLSFDDLREPSPVSSTTKDRSSVLFQSSPSTREELADRPREHATPPHYPVVAEHSGNQASRDLAEEVRSTNLPTERSSSVTAERASRMTSPTRHAGTSLFGGPVGIVSDVKSPPRSPFSPDGSSQRRLDTITEYSPEESPLHKKGRHPSDVGLPEHGIKSLRHSGRPQSLSQQRVLSPPGREEGAPKNLISTDDLIARLSWPPVDEEKHAVDLERSRSRSRNTDHSHHGNAPAGVPRESDRRSVSGASIRSGDSINAIIRTPDQVRSVSGQSFRSSGTPPLRRVDHRVSGDLRLANKKSEAKLAKDLEAEEHDIVAIASSSTYDPIKDKGKTRAKDMADVYVSKQSRKN